MPWLTINGLEVDARESGGFQIQDESIRTFKTAADGSIQGTFVKERFSIDFKSDYLSPDDGNALIGWITGRGHQWSFTVALSTSTPSIYSDDGGLKFTGATTGDTSAKFGSHHLIVHPSGSGVATATFGSERNWSVALWHRPQGGSWDFYAVTSKAGVEAYYTVTGVTANMFPFFAVTAASGFLRLTLQGENTSGSSATASYDSVRMVPYALTDDMVSALAARTAECPAPPYIGLDGDSLSDYNSEIEGYGVISSVDHTVISQAGVKVNAKTLSVKLTKR
jgi:hypothetical protein